MRNWLPIYVICFVSLACRNDMHDQPKYQPLEQSRFFPDGRASRNPPEHTVAQGQLNADELFYTGKVGKDFSAFFPRPVDFEFLQRGQQRFNIYCAECHDRTGGGNGVVVQRGYRKPPAMGIQRLKDAPPGYLFDVMTHGLGAMPKYDVQVSVEDRWAIAAFIRALQLSQSAQLGDLPEQDRQELAKVRP